MIVVWRMSRVVNSIFGAAITIHGSLHPSLDRYLIAPDLYPAAKHVWDAKCHFQPLPPTQGEAFFNARRVKWIYYGYRQRFFSGNQNLDLEVFFHSLKFVHHSHLSNLSACSVQRPIVNIKLNQNFVPSSIPMTATPIIFGHG
jgi:hypothetical protein